MHKRLYIGQRQTKQTTSESPGKRGRLEASSANMAPTDHASTGGAYDWDPSNISGARYQSVTTS